MSSARAINVLDPASAVYIAGLVDGEGTVTLTRLHANENRRLVVSISNNDLTLLAFVSHCVGAGKITRKRTYQRNMRPRSLFRSAGDRRSRSWHVLPLTCAPTSPSVRNLLSTTTCP